MKKKCMQKKTVTCPAIRDEAIEQPAVSVAGAKDFDDSVTAEYRKDLLHWFLQNKRDLPWRHTYEPYAVWVSEIMLQQTQMERGVAYFNRWMERFSDIQSVAQASDEEILKAWEGLGYYSRAKNLHKTAKIIVEKYAGRFPETVTELKKLPGIGDYTAGAIVSIAFNIPEAAVDANAERVFTRLFDIAMPCKSTVAAGFIKQLTEAFLKGGHAREMTQAIMELGALICKKKPLCAECPLSGRCEANRLGITAERPIMGKRTAATALQVSTGVLVHKGKVFIQKRLDRGVWGNLWEFPGGRIEEGEEPDQAECREIYEETGFQVRAQQFLGSVNHAYTRYRIKLFCYLCRFKYNLTTDLLRCGIEIDLDDGLPFPSLTAASDYRWVDPDELNNYAMPAAHRKLVDEWLQDIKQFAKEW